jgi:hypothetical protein
MTDSLIHLATAKPEIASGPSMLMVELAELRRRMVRDLEQFLSFELSVPRALPWPMHSTSGKTIAYPAMIRSATSC